MRRHHEQQRERQADPEQRRRPAVAAGPCEHRQERAAARASRTALVNTRSINRHSSNVESGNGKVTSHSRSHSGRAKSRPASMIAQDGDQDQRGLERDRRAGPGRTARCRARPPGDVAWTAHALPPRRADRPATGAGSPDLHRPERALDVGDRLVGHEGEAREHRQPTQRAQKPRGRRRAARAFRSGDPICVARHRPHLIELRGEAAAG